MKIAIVAAPHFPIPPKAYGGTERVIYYLIKGLMELGHEPILLASQDSEVECELIPTVSKAIPYPKRKFYLETYKKWITTVEKRTYKELRKLLPSVDIVHSHGIDMKDFQDFPNVTTVHNMIQFDDLPYFIKRKDFPFVAISQNQKMSLPFLNYAGVVYNGMDPGEYQVVTKPKNYLTIYGRIERHKGTHLAIQLALSKNMPIKIAGKLDYWSSTYYKEEIKKYMNHPLVEYLGEISEDEKKSLAANASCNLHPLEGWREPFGLTLLEAGYSGTPTLGMNKGSLPEVIQQGKNGMLVEDFIEGYTVLDDCLKLDRKEVANNVRRRFNYLKMAEGYIDVYKKVIADQKKR